MSGAMGAEKGAVLTGLARQAIAKRLGIKSDVISGEEHAWLYADAATFVTLTMHGVLRGCIGTLEAYRPLIEDVQANAAAAAFQDPRFPPLTADEFDLVRVEVSVLTSMQPLLVSGESEALATIRPGIDGVVLEFVSARAMNKGTFLPQVWEQLPDPGQFMAHLKLKAGLPADFWHPDVRLFTYQVEKYKELKD